MILGVTASRNGATDEQEAWLRDQIAQCTDLHHGACIGGDELSHDIAIELGKVIIIHPPTNESKMMPRWKFSQRECIYVRAAKPYHVRNRNIVTESVRLIALPDGPYRPHSGTWMTIGFAEKAGKRATICYPDGTVDDRDPSFT